MGQIGSKLKRLVAVMEYNHNMDSPFLFSKIDIADIFWYIVVSHIQAWNLCYVLSASNDWTVSIGKAELVVATALQMEWQESPPFLYAVSETARDIISDLVK